jgi:hypothetical protein
MAAPPLLYSDMATHILYYGGIKKARVFLAKSKFFIDFFEVIYSLSGKLGVRFVSPWYWRVAEVVSLLTLAALVAWYFIIARRRRIL